MAENVSALARQLSASLQGNSRPQFEFQFNQLQNLYIRQLNDKVTEIADADNTKRERDALVKKSGTLRETAIALEAYTFGNISNQERLTAITETTAALVASVQFSGDETDVTAAEVSQFSSVRNKLIDEIDKLQLLYQPDFLRPDIIQEVITFGEELKSKGLVEGAVDVEGTVATTNTNRSTQDFAIFVQGRIQDALTVTGTTVTAAQEASKNTLAKLSVIQADRIKIAQVDAKNKQEAIDKENNRIGQLLQAISLSFEINRSFAEGLGKSLLEGNTPQPGTILSILS